MKSRTRIVEREDYRIQHDPNGKDENSWFITWKNGPWEGLSGRYINIEPSADGNAINYEFEYIRVPPGMSTEWTPQFDAMVRETFMNIVQRRHELGDTMYIDKKTGVRVDV